MFTRSLLSPVFCALLLSGHALPALDLTFRSATDVEDNFEAVAGKPTVSFVDEEGGVLRFTAAEKLTFARLAVINRRGSFLGLEEGTVEVTFRFREYMESFGVLLRVTGNDAKAYLCLVNLSENRVAALRIFKVSPLETPNDENRLSFNASKSVFPDEWYRLRVKIRNVGKDAVEVEGELLPENGSGAIISGAVKDADNPVPGAGQIQLRMYSPNIPSEIDVRRVEITPEPVVLR